jgi:hypothetical protein
MPATSTIDRADGPQAVDEGIVWELEELGEFKDARGARWSNRWLGVVVAAAVAIVGFGFVGRWSSDDPVTTRAEETRQAADAPPPARPDADPVAFVLTDPVDGEAIDGSVVEVRGVAHRAFGTVHLAVRLGDAVLGWTNLDVRERGAVSATIRVFAPSFSVPVVLSIDSAATRSGAGLAIALGLRLHAPAAVAVWRTALTGPSDAPSVLVEGYGPETTRDLRVQVYAADARGIAIGAASVGHEDGRPGALGGGMLGLGSFTVRLTLDEPAPGEALVVSVTWRDHAGGSLHETRQVTRSSTKPPVDPERRR